MNRTIPVDEWNASAPLGALNAAPTPVDAFYTRSNFGVPDVDVSDWRLTVDGQAEGPRLLAVRATDEAGNTQPLDPVWNRNGYANNVVHRVRVVVE